MGRRKSKKLNIWQYIFVLIIFICISAYGYINQNDKSSNPVSDNASNQNIVFDLNTIPEYSEKPYVEINNNNPYFTEEDYTIEPFEKYIV